jgi:hypothetical protein
LPAWLDWESECVLAGTPPTPTDEEGYKVPIMLTASYNAFGMSHVIESRLELDIRSPGSGMGDLASSLRNAANVQNVSSGNSVMESGMDVYLDDDDDEMMYVTGHAVFSSENNTPPSAITPSTTNPNQLLYVPSQSLQNSPLKQNMMGPTPPASGPSLSNRSMNPLTPTLSPIQSSRSSNLSSTVVSASNPYRRPSQPINPPNSFPRPGRYVLSFRSSSPTKQPPLRYATLHDVHAKPHASESSRLRVPNVRHRRRI